MQLFSREAVNATVNRKLLKRSCQWFPEATNAPVFQEAVSATVILEAITTHVIQEAENASVIQEATNSLVTQQAVNATVIQEASNAHVCPGSCIMQMLFRYQSMHLLPGMLLII
jgi:hypothetical protein